MRNPICFDFLLFERLLFPSDSKHVFLTFQKTMEDGNTTSARDENISSTSHGNLYGERPAKFTTNGHDFGGESSSPTSEPFEQRRSSDAANDDKHPKRINPLRIHLGKRPFVDNSLQYYNPLKRKKSVANKINDTTAPTPAPRAPKLIPKRSQFQNVTSHVDSIVDNEQDKPVPRLVPKSQLMQYKRGKPEKGKQMKGPPLKVPPLKEYAQSLGLQPMVKFKCRKCCSMSFKTLAMLKEHQLACRAQAKEPALSPEAAPNAAGSESNTSGPSRVTRKVYLCSACGTYYENWNLFLHMREKHKRHICLFCLGMFSKAERLSTHLTNKHNVKEFNYDSKEDFFKVYNGTLYLMCCECDEICSEQDDFFNHDCGNIKSIPVPLLVSKNAVKPNSVQNTISSNDISINGSTNVLKCTSEKKENKETMIETVTKPAQEPKLDEILPSSTKIHFENPSTVNKDVSSSGDSEMELDNSVSKPMPSPVNWNAYNAEPTNNVPNGDESHSEESDSPVSDDVATPIKETVQPASPEKVCPPSEKECGIKLKLSLNNANSPVIINSTVDPTVGQQIANKPPSRNRRPPKRYEKDKLSQSLIQPKTPSIKMTICDRADSPFVKTTIYENNKIETTVKTILNNNFDTVSKSPEHKPESTIKTTIYDNKPENDENTLNRVPKLTVRVPKELLDKDSSSDYSSDSDGSDKLTVDEHNTTIAEHPEEPIKTIPEEPPMELNVTTENVDMEVAPDIDSLPPSIVEPQIEVEPKTEQPEPELIVEPTIEEPSITVTELSLIKPLDKYPLKDLLKVFLASTVYNCIYCNHVRKIAVNCEQLSLHMVAEHRFSATVDSITAEELLPETITAKLQSGAAELKTIFINLNSYDSSEKSENVQYEHVFECFQCYFKTAVHKDLCLHNRKMHQKSILLCVMCKSNFFSYSELLCHLCPGTYDSEYEVKFKCCFCNVDSIPSQFRLMVHLRKIHHTCDVCLEFCHNQARLSNHVWKHKLHHFCYRCGIAYRNKPDITNHLFWKHGTESILCKKCMQKKWPHVYHFCNPPAVFACDECNLQFSRPVCLKVHKRFHSLEFPHACTEENCTEKFVSKKLLNKHIDEHLKKLVTEELNDVKPVPCEPESETPKEIVPVIDLVDEKPSEEAGTSEVKKEVEPQQPSKKLKKKKIKDKDALLLDVNLPALNLSESDSSDESDSGLPALTLCKEEDERKERIKDDEPNVKEEPNPVKTEDGVVSSAEEPISEAPSVKVEDKPGLNEDEKPSEQQVLDIWDNFKKYQAKVDKQKTPPLVSIRKHVCESDHDYCLVPTDMNGEDDSFNLDKKKNKKTPKKNRGGGLSSSSSSSSDSDSSCSCGPNCSCSSSSASSSSSSSDSDTSDDSGNEKKKIKRIRKKSLPNRRISNGSNVDVMGMSETPILIPEKVEPPIAESDLETAESETDEEFYDENPQLIANKMHEEKRNQLMLLASAEASESGLVSEENTHSAISVKDDFIKDDFIKDDFIQHDFIKDDFIKDDHIKEDDGREGEWRTEPAEMVPDEKPTSSKKKSKKKKKSKSSRKHAPIKINIPKDVIAKSEMGTPPPLPPNKITISLQSNTVQIPAAPVQPIFVTPTASSTTAATSAESKRASKRRRVPNKFYGYSSDDEHSAQQLTPTPLSALKPQQPPKLEWRKEDLPSPVTSRVKKEIPSTILTNRLYNNYTDPIRLTAPIPDPEPPKILMNSESMESSDSDSSDEGNLEIFQPSSIPPIPPPNYLNSGTSSLPYAFQRPPVREAREGESVYCYCRCPYDEVSEMIACDAEGCPIEWFHFECVGIMVPPKGKWYCPECRKNLNFSGYR